jgi:cell division inhibitor SepF
MVYLGLQDDDEYGYDAHAGYGYDDQAGYGQGYDDRPGYGGGQGQGQGQGYDDQGGYETYGHDQVPPQPAYPSGQRSSDVRPIGAVGPDSRTVAVRDHPGHPAGPSSSPGGVTGAATGVGMGEPTVRPLPRDDQPSGVSVSRPAVVRAVPTTAGKVHVVEPRGFNDAQEVGDRVKANQAVILNLQASPKELRRRLIDFSSGLAYAMGGSMSRVADAVFLITPLNVQLSEEEKDRLEARGLYQRDD